MRTIKLTVVYDGSDFVGWQVQPNGESVQAVLQRALGEMVCGECQLTGAGRTDAGVHALAQAASFNTDASIPCDGFVKGLNSILPASIAVLSAEEVKEGFNARYAAKGKVYRYILLHSPVRLPLLSDRVWRVSGKLSLADMRKAAGHLVGKHDFESFRASGCAAEHAVRTIERIDVSDEVGGGIMHELPSESGLIYLEFKGDGFVRHMIRNIVGTLVDVGQGRISAGDVERILGARQRKEAGLCAPASGLYLVRVIY